MKAKMLIFYTIKVLKVPDLK